MEAVKRLLLLDFVLSLAAGWYFLFPHESAAQFGACGPEDVSVGCQLALLNMRLFFGKSLAHSTGILVGALSREPRTVAIVAGGVCLWCICMATLQLRSPFAAGTMVASTAVMVFAGLYAGLLLRWGWLTLRRSGSAV